MNKLVIDKKKYLLIQEKDYQALQKKAALQKGTERVFSIKQARTYSKKLIKKSSEEKR